MFEQFSKALKKKKGFTLVELMVVVAIIGILVAIAVPVYNNVTTKAEQRAVEANLRTIDGAISQASLLTDETIDKELIEGYLQEWPEGPGTATYGITDAAPYRATVSSGDETVGGVKLGGDNTTSLPITWP